MSIINTCPYDECVVLCACSYVGVDFLSRCTMRVYVLVCARVRNARVCVCVSVCVRARTMPAGVRNCLRICMSRNVRLGQAVH